jgi:DNA modification methylase
MDRLILADCIEAMRAMPDNSVDSIVTDPPYHLTTDKKGGSGSASVNLESPYGRAKIGAGFMGMKWDGGDVAMRIETWAEALRVLKPGGHLLAFSGSRTYHRMVCAIEDAGFEVRDQIMWLYGSGFPKSLDVSKAIDKAAGAEPTVVGKRDRLDQRSKPAHSKGIVAQGMKKQFDALDIMVPTSESAKQWQGWGTALKPAHEPICVARKPLIGTVATNVLEHGTGALNIDGCRVGTDERTNPPTGTCIDAGHAGRDMENFKEWQARQTEKNVVGRWPANVIHDGSPEVVDGFPQSESSKPSDKPRGRRTGGFGDVGADKGDGVPNGPQYGDAGSAARFFYCAKASKKDRGDGNVHPTVKPTELMAYLVRLVTPPGGVVLDPFMGSGSTGKACAREGFDFIGIDMTPEYVDIARARIAAERARIAAERAAQEKPALAQAELFCV